MVSAILLDLPGSNTFLPRVTVGIVWCEECGLRVNLEFEWSFSQLLVVYFWNSWGVRLQFFHIQSVADDVIKVGGCLGRINDIIRMKYLEHHPCLEHSKCSVHVKYCYFVVTKYMAHIYIFLILCIIWLGGHITSQNEKFT